MPLFFISSFLFFLTVVPLLADALGFWEVVQSYPRAFVALAFIATVILYRQLVRAVKLRLI